MRIRKPSLDGERLARMAGYAAFVDAPLTGWFGATLPFLPAAPYPSCNVVTSRHACSAHVRAARARRHGAGHPDEGRDGAGAPRRWHVLGSHAPLRAHPARDATNPPMSQVLWGPTIVFVYLTTHALLRGGGVGGVSSSLRRGWLSAVVASYRVWPLVYLANFSLIPEAHRVTFTAAVSAAPRRLAAAATPANAPSRGDGAGQPLLGGLPVDRGQQGDLGRLMRAATSLQVQAGIAARALGVGLHRRAARHTTAAASRRAACSGAACAKARRQTPWAMREGCRSALVPAARVHEHSMRDSMRILSSY